MQEASFRLECTENSVSLDYNYVPLVLKYTMDRKGVYIWYFDSERRFSFSGDRLMDMRALRTLRGDEARSELLRVITEKSPLIVEGIGEVENHFGVDLSLLRALADSLVRDIKTDPRAFLDINVERIAVEVNREFKKDAPGLQSVRKFVVTLRVKGAEAAVTLWDDGNREVVIDDVSGEDAVFKFRSMSFSTLNYKRLHSSIVTRLSS